MTKVMLLARNFALKSYLDSHISTLKSIATLSMIDVESEGEFGCTFSPRSILSIPREFFQLRKILKLERPDLVVTIGPKIGLLMAVYKTFYCQKNVHWFTGQIWAGKPFLSIYYWIDYFICLKSSYIATDAHHQKETLEKHFFKGTNKIFVPHPFSIDGVSRRLSNSKPIPQKQKLLYLGRLAPEKGLGFIADCATDLVNLPNVASLTIAGPLDPDWVEGPAMLLKLQRVENIQVLEGYHDKQKMLSEHDTLLLCSDREGLPVVLIEAIVAGLRPVCTFNEGIQEVMNYFRMGDFVCRKNRSEFVDIVRKIDGIKPDFGHIKSLSEPLFKDTFEKAITKFYMNVIADAQK